MRDGADNERKVDVMRDRELVRYRGTNERQKELGRERGANKIWREQLRGGGTNEV